MNIFYCKYCKKYSILRMVLYWEDALTVFSTDIIWGGGFQRGRLPRKSLIFAGARTESVGEADLPLSTRGPLYTVGKYSQSKYPQTFFQIISCSNCLMRSFIIGIYGKYWVWSSKTHNWHKI